MSNAVREGVAARVADLFPHESIEVTVYALNKLLDEIARLEAAQSREPTREEKLSIHREVERERRAAGKKRRADVNYVPRGGWTGKGAREDGR